MSLLTPFWRRNSKHVAMAIYALVATHTVYSQVRASTPRDIERRNGSAVIETASTVSDRFPKITPEGRPVVGLVLEGGGALGLAHIGVLLWLEENHIPVDRVAGTSMGALIGGLYASGMSPAQIKSLVLQANFPEVFTLQTSYSQLSYRRRQDRHDLPQAVTLGLKGGISARNALLSDTALNGLLTETFKNYADSEDDYDQLPIPFRCVATDLNTLEPVVFKNGPMSRAIRASISIPGIFSPVQDHDHYLVDGGILDNLPTGVARNDLGADVVIAVHLEGAKLSDADLNSILGVLSRAFSAAIAKSEHAGMANADVVVTAETAKFTPADYSRAAELIAIGYGSAEQVRNGLLRYRLSEIDWKKHLEARRERIAAAPGALLNARIEGGTEPVRSDVERNLSGLMDKPIKPQQIERALNRVQGNGSHTAWFETFHTADNAVEGVGSDPTVPADGVIVHLSKPRNGPPFLLVGGDVMAVTSNITRSTIDFRYVQQDFGGYGSELRADIRAGFLSHGAIEYYRRMPLPCLFVQPGIAITRQPVYMWQDQKRISERFQQEAGGTLDFGCTFNRYAQLSAQWKTEATRWELVSGSDQTQNLSGTARSGIIHFAYDSAVTGAVSPRGGRLDVSAGRLFHGVQDESAPIFRLNVSRSLQAGQNNVFGFRVLADTYFRRNVAQPYRFTLGGPLALSASSVDEYRGTDDVYVRGGYLRKVATLPSGLGQGLYIASAYEAGEIWSPEQRTFMRQDMVGGIVASTPFGVITFAGSAGDAGRRKIFFTLGKLF